MPDRPKIGGSTWTVTGTHEVRTYDDGPMLSLADPLAAFDPPEAPDLPYVEPASESPIAPTAPPPMTLEEEIEAAIDFEEPEPLRSVDRVVDESNAAAQL